MIKIQNMYEAHCTALEMLHKLSNVGQFGNNEFISDQFLMVFKGWCDFSFDDGDKAFHSAFDEFVATKHRVGFDGGF